jgi:starvation-inducible DNA-binding protein
MRPHRDRIGTAAPHGAFGSRRSGGPSDLDEGGSMNKIDKASSDKGKSALAAPTDLSSNGVKAISAALNGLAADAFTLYVKTKNFHWHMSGPHFRDYHLLLDEQGTQIFEMIDPLAERVRKLGQTTLRSIGHVGELQSIKDNDEPFVGPLAMLSELAEDNRTFAASMRKAHGLCDDNDDVASASLLEVWIDEAERRSWFLFEAARGADDSGH